MSAPSLDVHAHVWLSAVEDAVSGQFNHADASALELRRLGADSAAVNKQQANLLTNRLTDVSTRLAAMDSAGVDIQLVSVVPTQYHSWADRRLAETVSLLTNAGVAQHCAQAPHRLIGLGVAPLAHPELAVASLEDAVLTHGLRGVEIGSHAADPAGGTIDLSDRRLDRLWQRASELDAVIFLHPWGCTLDERLDQWYLANSVGQPVEHAVALSHLIVSGVLDRFPDLRIIAAHGGGYLPAFVARADHAWKHRPDARGCAEAPSAYLRRIWFDSLVYTSSALRHLIDVVGSNQVVLGSDFPFDMGEPDPVGKIAAAGLPHDIRDALIGANALRLGLSPTVSALRRA